MQKYTTVSAENQSENNLPAIYKFSECCSIPSKNKIIYGEAAKLISTSKK